MVNGTIDKLEHQVVKDDQPSSNHQAVKDIIDHPSINH